MPYAPLRCINNSFLTRLRVAHNPIAVLILIKQKQFMIYDARTSLQLILCCSMYRSLPWPGRIGGLDSGVGEDGPSLTFQPLRTRSQRLQPFSARFGISVGLSSLSSVSIWTDLYHLIKDRDTFDNSISLFETKKPYCQVNIWLH